MSFELNKIAGAILGTLLLVMGLGFLAEAIYAPIEDKGPGYALPEPEAGASAAPVEVVAATPLPVLLASASAENGAADSRKCASCHNFAEGAGNKTGPDLYGVVGRPIASHEGFSYSDALIAYGAEQGNWTYEALAAFIHDPRGDVEGTKMTFAGIKDEQELADILAYLQTLSATPVPFPAVEEVVEVAPATEEHAAADEATEAPATEEPAAAPEEPAMAVEEPAAAADEAAMAAEEPAMSAEPAPPVEEPVMAAEAPVMAVEQPAAAGDSDLEAAIANASLDDGAAALRSCRACHDWVEGGRNKVGPLLYDVVGRQIASEEGYNYSDAMKAFAADNGVWTYELLNTWITDPRALIPGTKMSYGGMSDAGDRAAAIALLRHESPNPAPLAGAQ